MTNLPFLRYDPAPMSEQDAEREAMWERLRREGGVLVNQQPDGTWQLVGIVSPAQEPDGSTLRFDVTPPQVEGVGLAVTVSVSRELPCRGCPECEEPDLAEATGYHEVPARPFEEQP